MRIQKTVTPPLPSRPGTRQRETIGGTRVSWWEYPADRDGEPAVPVVLVHGFRGTHHGLAPIVAAMPETRFIAPDLPGFGESEPNPAGHDLDAYAAWLTAFLERVDPRGEAVVLGHSFGSLIVARNVRALGARRRIVLVNPIAAPAMTGADRLFAQLARLFYRTGEVLPERAGTALLRSRLVTRAMSEIMAVTRHRGLRRAIHAEHDARFSTFANRRALAEAFAASISDSVIAHAADFPPGTVLIAGMRDAIAPARDQCALVRAMPGASLHLIEGVGHLIHYEKPAAAARILRAALASPPPPASPPRGAAAASAAGTAEAAGEASFAPRGREGMRLFFDCRYVRADRHDGISRYSAELVRALGELHPVTMIVSDPRQLAVLPPFPHVFTSGPTSAREPFIARQLNRLRPDVVCSPMQTMGSLGRRYGLVLTIHDLIYYSERRPPRQFSAFIRLLWRLYHLSYLPQRLLLRGADEVATISATTRELMRRHHLTGKPVQLVGNAPDERFRAERTGILPNPPERGNLVYMGSFMPYKNVETIARAMRELPGWTLHLCSRIDDAHLAELERLAPPGAIIAHRGVSDEQYLELLRGATALVTASRAEGFGLPLIEAMAAGTPVACSDLPIFREVCGEAAAFFPADDPAALAAAVRRLAEPGAWRAAQAAGLARARDFSWRAAAASLLESCERIRAARREGRG